MLNKLLTVLRDISEVIAANKNYEDILLKIVKILANDLSVDVCSVYVFNEKANVLELKATEGLNIASVNKVKMRPGKGLTGTCFKKRSIMNVTDPEKHPEFIYFKETGEERYKSFLGVPLTIGGRCLGVLTIQRKKPRKFSPLVIDMVKSLSTQLANLILNEEILVDLSPAGPEFSKALKKKSDHGQIMLRGTAANQGIAKGNALKLENRDFFRTISHEVHTDSKKELEILKSAIELAKRKTVEFEEKALKMISEADASIFNAHLLFLEDKTLIGKIQEEITANKHSAEFSIKLVFVEFQEKFSRFGDEVFRDKIMDLKDVLLRLVESIRFIREGKAEPDMNSKLKGSHILFAHEMMPSDLLRLPMENISGIVCEKGGGTAHVAILARALDIPALMGVKGAIGNLSGKDEAVLDCHSEIVYIRPGKKVLRQFDEMYRVSTAAELPSDKTPALTTDGQEIILRANISLICETSLLDKYGASGIGLYRTEFLYMIRDRIPSEDEQCKVFSKIIEEAAGNEVAIRVLDTGGDKPLPYLNFPSEDNPALGVRGIRFLLSRRDIFKTQLKAILRAGIHGPLKILFPMVTSLPELISIKQVLAEAETELHENNVKHTESYKTGIMLEVPSMVFALEKVIPSIDFVSIGSNDLLQYTFAADRTNESVSENYNFLHPIFLKVIDDIGRLFKKYPKKELAICGEMAGAVHAVPFLIGAGIYQLSMTPKKIPLIKKIVRVFSRNECEKLLTDAKKLDNPEAVLYMVKQAFENKKIDI